MVTLVASPGMAGGTGAGPIPMAQDSGNVYVPAGVKVPAAAPAGTPANLAAAGWQVIEDDATAPGGSGVTYSGFWLPCTGCVAGLPNNRFQYTFSSNAQVQVSFTGTKVVLYGVAGPPGGYADILLDGTRVASVDTYAATIAPMTLYTSSELSPGAHTATIVRSDARNPSAYIGTVAFDRAEVELSAGGGSGGGSRSGLPWLSGVNGDPVISPASVDAFCNWRGSPCDLAHVYTDRSSWNSMVQPSFTETNFAGWPGRLVISTPPFPADGASNYTACANGSYDSYWRTFGNTLNSTGRQNSIIRLAWEMNGDWFPWAATNPALFIACWRHVVDAVRSTADPDPAFEFSINAHYSQNPPSHHIEDIYPGDAWVDSIGIDAYDHYPPSLTQAQFDAQANARDGITWLYNFAQAHGKAFGVGEWGVAPGSGANGGGDNANFIQYMWNWLQARAGKGILWETYFNNCDAGNVDSNLWRTVGPGCIGLNASAGARYKALWGS
jgi:hypothetical protein